jgi:hypothetical protein
MPEDGNEPIEIEPTGMPDVPDVSELEQLLNEDRPPPEMPEPPDWQYERPEPEDAPTKTTGPGTQAGFNRGMGLAFAIGSSFIGPVLGGLLVGYLIDGKVGGTAGIIGLLLGTVLAFVLLIRLVNKLNESS